MKKFYTLITFATLFAFGAFAQNRALNLTSNDNLSKMIVHENGDQKLFFRNCSSLKDIPTNYNLEVNSTHEGWQLYGMLIYNNESGYNLFFMTTDDVQKTVQIPQDTYDIMAIYTQNDSYAYVIKENIVLNQDLSIYFDVLEADHQLKVRTYAPDGNIWDTQVYSSDDNSLLSEGNAKNIDYFIAVYKEGAGNITGTMGNEIYHMSNIENYAELLDVKINNVSDAYSVVKTLVTTSNDGKIYFDNFEFNGTQEDLMTNNYNDYFKYSEHFILPITYSDEYVSGFNNDYLVYGKSWNGWNGEMGSVQAEESDLSSLYINLPQDKGVNQKRQMLVAPSLSNLKTIIDEYGRETKISNPIVGCYANVGRNNVEYVIGYKDAALRYTSYSKWNVDETMSQMLDYPGHELLGYNSEQKNDIYGNNTPVLFMSMIGYAYGGAVCPQWGINYMGRFGEVRNCDRPNLEIVVKNNGETMDCADYDYFMRSLPYDFVNNNVTGEVDIELNNNTVMVDNLNAYNHAIIHMNMSSSDWIAPTVRMLQFRNQDNLITDRFTDAADGKFILTAADINYNTTDYTHTVARPNSIEVAYSPLGYNSWTPMVINELSNYAYYNYGFTYEGNLNDVVEMAHDGWFDMRIRLQDESGNWQEQTISPAFQISSLTGINDINIENKEAIAYYTIDGICHKSPQQGVNIVRFNDGTISKIIIK